MFSVYKISNKEGQTIYIGCAINPVRRLANHRDTSPWYEEMSRVDVEWFEEKQEARLREGELIRELAPKHNVQVPLAGCGPDERKIRDRESSKLRQRAKRARDRKSIYEVNQTRKIVLTRLAERYNVHVRTIRRWIKSGKIDEALS